MSPNNGTAIIFDEMTSDLTPNEVGERIEYWKSILTNGQYSIERTCRAQKSDGSDSHITCEIVTDHSVANIICTNLGPCFTTGDKEPSSGKFAMINRTLTLFARKETSETSTAAQFDENLQRPEIMNRVRRFRLFTCLVAFVKLAMRKCSWLQPDIGLAKKMWKENDRILSDEYNMPLPEARRTQRRAEVCRTQCIMEAVARVFLYKQTALSYEAGRPVEGTNVAKTFDIADLWDVIRVASIPTRAVIRDSWLKSLTYSIATSPNGINVMTSLCEMAKITVNEVFKKLPTETLSQLTSDTNLTNAQEFEDFLKNGANTKQLHRLGDQMSRDRRLRCKWRKKASQTNISNRKPLEVIHDVVSDESAEQKLEYANALMPTVTQIAMHYKIGNALKWAAGDAVDIAADLVNGNPSKLNPCKIDSSGGAQQYDHAWLMLKATEGEFVKFHSILGELRNGNSPVKLFGYHDAGIQDTLLLLETSEAARLCPEMPRVTNKDSPHIAFVDDRNNIPNKESKTIRMKDYGNIPAHLSDAPIDCRIDEDGSCHYTRVDVQRNMDVLLSRNRLPAMQPYTSSNLVKCSPVRRVRNSGVMLNTVAAFEHMSMVIESSITCSKYDGLKDHQEDIDELGSTGLQGLMSRSNGGESQGDENDDSKTKTLPFSNDLVQIAWAIDTSERQYIDNLGEELRRFNEAIESGDLVGEKIKIDDIPQQPIACMGYPISMNDVRGRLKVDKRKKNSPDTILQLMSIPVRTDPKFEVIEVSDTQRESEMDEEILIDEVMTALGRRPTSGDIQAYKRDRIGDSFMYEVSGDMNAYTTWCNHMRESMVCKGNAMPNDDGAVESMMDCELMLLCRMYERLASVESNEEFKYNITHSTPRSYTARIKMALEKQSREQAEESNKTKRKKQPTGTELNAMNNRFKSKRARSNAILNQRPSEFGNERERQLMERVSASGAGSSSMEGIMSVENVRDLPVL